MNKVTYIFGAGASKLALPIVDEIPERIVNLIQFLKHQENHINEGTTFKDLGVENQKTDKEYYQEMIDSLIWMMKESKNHASIDTFAKKLFITRKHKELIRLKVIMSIFFIIEQSIKKVDYRYDAFFASILTNSITSLPSNIQILSWNYDYQFEIAFSAFSEQKSIYQNQSFLNLISKNHSKENDAGFSILKLNGTTSLHSGRGMRRYEYILDLDLKTDKTFLSTITRSYASGIYMKDIYPSLSFAWEGEDNDTNILSIASERTVDTTTLIIIGYSFPFFNRVIDRKIISGMTNLQRVYIQDPNAEIIKERFLSLKEFSEKNIITKNDVGQFFIPNEI